MSREQVHDLLMSDYNRLHQLSITRNTRLLSKATNSMIALSVVRLVTEKAFKNIQSDRKTWNEAALEMDRYLETCYKLLNIERYDHSTS